MYKGILWWWLWGNSCVSVCGKKCGLRLKMCRRGAKITAIYRIPECIQMPRTDIIKMVESVYIYYINECLCSFWKTSENKLTVFFWLYYCTVFLCIHLICSFHWSVNIFKPFTSSFWPYMYECYYWFNNLCSVQEASISLSFSANDHSESFLWKVWHHFGSSRRFAVHWHPAQSSHGTDMKAERHGGSGARDKDRLTFHLVLN